MDLSPFYITTMASLLGGGACGAFINEYFRKKRTLTQVVPLLERINRDPLESNESGVRYCREQANGQLTKIERLRQFQMTLHNTTEQDLEGATILFEFSCEGVEAWSSATQTGRHYVAKMPEATDPSHRAFPRQGKTFVQWQFTQFSSGDSIDFSVLAFEPKATTFEASIYGKPNIQIKKIAYNQQSIETPEPQLSLVAVIALVVFCLILVAFTAWASFR